MKAGLQMLAPELSDDGRALLIRHLQIEHGQPLGNVFNFNVGNITSNEDGVFWRPPWFTVTDASSERDKQLHALMVLGKAPKAFRAHGDLLDGIDDYVRQLQTKFPTVWAAVEKHDGSAMARELVKSGYCPDCKPADLEKHLVVGPVPLVDSEGNLSPGRYLWSVRSEEEDIALGEWLLHHAGLVKNRGFLGGDLAWHFVYTLEVLKTVEAPPRAAGVGERLKPGETADKLTPSRDGGSGGPGLAEYVAYGILGAGALGFAWYLFGRD
jgi:hypothetical protein